MYAARRRQYQATASEHPRPTLGEELCNQGCLCQDGHLTHGAVLTSTADRRWLAGQRAQKSKHATTTLSAVDSLRGGRLRYSRPRDHCAWSFRGSCPYCPEGARRKSELQQPRVAVKVLTSLGVDAEAATGGGD